MGRGDARRLTAVTVALALCTATSAALTDATLLPDTLTVLEDTLRSIAERLPYINEDVVVGLRIVADQLQLEIGRLNSTLGVRDRGFVYPRSANALDIAAIKSKIEFLRDFTENYILQGRDIVRRQVLPDRYSTLLVPLSEEGRWRLDFPQLRINVDHLVEPEYNTEFREDLSDDCIRELTSAEDSRRCTISPDCMKTMTQRNATGYWLTHEVFYMFIAYTTPCYDKVLSYLRTHGWRSLQDFLEKSCTNVLRDAEIIASSGFPARQQDLFIEQIGFCGLAGVKEMYRPEWMREIFSWKRPRSCFGLEDVSAAGNTRRRKRAISLSDDMCHLHKTVLGAINTAVALRYLLH